VEAPWSPASRSRAECARIAIVGKYTQLHDAYLSVSEACTTRALPGQRRVEILWIDSET
jgi:CTP synthase